MTKKSIPPIVQLGYEEYTTAKGNELKVYTIPTTLVRTIKPVRPKPKRPTVEMKIAGGKTQARAIKNTDAGWEEYAEELNEWEEEKKDLQDAVGLVLALRDFQFPDPIKFPDEIVQLEEDGLIEIPTDKYLCKALYLETIVLTEQDRLEISWLVQKLSGVPEEIIDEMKASFRDILLGKNSKGVGKDISDFGEETEGDD